MTGLFGKTKSSVNSEATDIALREKALSRTMRARMSIMLLAQALSAYLLIALPEARDGAWLSMALLLLPAAALYCLSRLPDKASLKTSSALPRAILLGLCLVIDIALLTGLLCGLLRENALTTSPTWLIAPLAVLFAALGAWTGAKSGAARACDVMRFLLPVVLLACVWLSGSRLDAGMLYPMPEAKTAILPALGCSGGVWAMALTPPAKGERDGERKGGKSIMWLVSGALIIALAALIALHGSLAVRWNGYPASLTASKRLLMPLQGAPPALTDGLIATICAVMLLSMISGLSLLKRLFPKGGLIACALALAAGISAALMPEALELAVMLSPYRWILAAAGLFVRRKGA